MILKTTNGGTEWIQQNGHGYLTQIHPVNDSVGYVCGEYIIMKTTNGGDNWFSLKEGPSQVPIIYGLWFNNENTGWFCGDRVAMRTTNGGQTFIDSMFMTNTCNDIHFKNDSVGNIAAYSKMFRTTNSGENWSPIPLPDFTERITFISDTGWTVGWSRIVYRTTNYGISWDSLTYIPFVSNERAYCIDFANYNYGYCGGYNGKIFKTTNGGFNWQINLNIGIGPFTSIFAFNDSTAWAVGGPGSRYIMNTINGGVTNIDKIYANQKNQFILYQNFPNPFNSNSFIQFNIQSYSLVTLKIYDNLGKEVMTLVNEFRNAGSYIISFNASNLSSGIYYYKIKSGSFNDIKKMIILK